MRRALVLVALAAGVAQAKTPKSKGALRELRVRVSADVALAALTPKLPDRAVVVGDELLIGPLAEAAAWARAVDLLGRQPWSAAGAVIDAVRVVEPGQPPREVALPDAAAAARWTGGRAGRRLTKRVSGFAFPDFALPPAAEEIATLPPPPPPKSKKPPPFGVLVMAEREVCDVGGKECLAWLRVLMPARGGGVTLAWAPLAQVWIPGNEAFQLRRLGRDPSSIAWDAISRKGARTNCQVAPDALPPVRAIRARKPETAVLVNENGATVGTCDEESISPPR